MSETDVVTFVTPGMLDLNNALLFGASVKSEGSIGKFGTGLKYAIAGILRAGGKVEVFYDDFVGGARHTTFFTRPQLFNGRQFNVVCMEDGSVLGGKSCGFTTELGKHWELWMLYRELWSNTKDEGGAVIASRGVSDILSSQITPTPTTAIVVSNFPEFAAVHKRNSVCVFNHTTTYVDTILHNAVSEPVLVIRKSIVSDDDNYPQFYRGIRVLSTSEQPLYTYNVLTELPLTEDRTVDTNDYKAAVRDAIMQYADYETVLAFLDAEYDSFEGSITTAYMPTALKLSDAAIRAVQFSASQRAKDVVMWQARNFSDDDLKELPLTEKQRCSVALLQQFVQATATRAGVTITLLRRIECGNQPKAVGVRLVEDAMLIPAGYFAEDGSLTEHLSELLPNFVAYRDTHKLLNIVIKTAMLQFEHSVVH